MSRINFRPLWRGPAFALAAVALASCADVPTTSISPKAAAESLRARSLDDPSLRDFVARADPGRGAWPPARLDGRALALVALYDSSTVQLARAKWRVAEAAVRTAGQRPNPTLSFDPLYVANAAAGATPWMISATLVQLFETAKKRPYRVARARYLAESARLDLLSAGWDAVGRVESLLLDLSASQARLNALDRQVAAQSGLVEAADKRLRVGLGSSLELVTARSVLSRTVLDRQATVAAQADTLHQLAIAIGLPAERLTLDRLALPSLVRDLPTGFIERVRRAAPLNRADLLARLSDYAASDAEVRLQLAGRNPNVEVGPGFEYDQGDRKWGLTVVATLPVFNRNEGAIGEALAQRRQAADQFTASQATVIGEVDRAATAYQEATHSLAVAERLYAEQARRARAQEALFARGEIDRVEVLSARAELAAGVTGRADAQGALAKAALAVEAAGHLRADGFDPTPMLLSEVKP